MSKERIILGLASFGPAPFGRVSTIAEFQECLDIFQAAGYSEVDTAARYAGGQQESWSEKAGLTKRGLTIATKYNPAGAVGGGKVELIEASCNKSLDTLMLDTLEIFYLHAPDRTTPFQEQLQAINNLHKQGKIKTFGLSNFTASEVTEICLTCKYNGWIRPTIYQGPYNLFARGPEQELIPVLRRFGLAYVCYNPIAGGLLTSKHKTLRHSPGDSGRFSDQMGPFGKINRDTYLRDVMFEAIDVIEAAGSPHQLDIQTIAYRWLLYHSELKTLTKGGDDGILIGCSSPAQLSQNLAAIEGGPLPEEVVDACEAAWQSIKGSAPVYFFGKNEYAYDTLEALYGKNAL